MKKTAGLLLMCALILIVVFRNLKIGYALCAAGLLLAVVSRLLPPKEGGDSN